MLRRKQIMRRMLLGGALLGVLASGLLTWTVTAGGSRDAGAIAVEGTPYAAKVAALTHLAFVVTQGRTQAVVSVSVIDTRRGRVVRTVTLPQGNTDFRQSRQAIAIDPRTEHVFIVNSPHNSVSVLDARSGLLLKDIGLPWGPGAVAVDEQRGHVFVIGERISLLDTATNTVIRTLPVGGTAVAVAAQTGRVFVADEGAGTVHMLDAATGTILRTVSVGAMPMALAVNARTGRVFVTSILGNYVSVLDAQSGRVLRTIPVGAAPSAVAVDAQTNRVFVVNSGQGQTAGSVSILNGASGAVLRTVFVPGSPQDVAVDLGTGRVLAISTLSGEVTVLDAATGLVVRSVPVGGGPHTIAVDPRTGRAVVSNAGLFRNGTTTHEPLERIRTSLAHCSWGGLGPRADVPEHITYFLASCSSGASDVRGTVTIIDMRH